MSNTIVNKIRKLPMDSTPKMLLWVISDIADESGSTGWFAPRSRLMEETGYSHTTIALCLAYLKECGVLKIIGGNGKQNYYVVEPENFKPEVKYMPKKQAKPVSAADQSTELTRQPGLPVPVSAANEPGNLAEKPVSAADTIHHIPLYPSSYPSIGDSMNPPNAELEPKAKRITKKQAGINRLVDLGCEEKYAKDWMTARKGAELTDSVVENLTEQAAIANITIAQAVQWVAKKGWQGFKADWYLKDQQQATPTKPVVQQAPRFSDLLKTETIRDVTPPKKSNEVRYVC